MGINGVILVASCMEVSIPVACVRINVYLISTFTLLSSGFLLLRPCWLTALLFHKV